MELIIGIIFIIWGITMFIKPHLLFKITESWKYYSPAEPSDLYIFNAKVGGVFVTLAGIASVVVFFIL